MMMTYLLPQDLNLLTLDVYEPVHLIDITVKLRLPQRSSPVVWDQGWFRSDQLVQEKYR